MNEPETLLLFKGAVYECTYNEDGHFSTSQICMLFDLPSQDVLLNFRKIEVLVAPPDVQDVEYNTDKSKEEYIAEGWKVEMMGKAPERVYKIKNRIHAQRRQHGLRHRVTSTIHASMGVDTLIKVAIEVSNTDSQYKLWNKSQVIVACSRTKVGRNTIFVGDMVSIIDALVSLIRQKNQWTDYMEKVLDLTTMNGPTAEDQTEEVAPGRRVFNTERCFPFRLCDVSLPSCKTGFVYSLISLRDPSFSYIGKTMDINRRLQQHNSGNDSSSTAPQRLRPYAIFAYICGFEHDKTLLSCVEFVWKEKRDRLCNSGIQCQKQWARRGGQLVIKSVCDRERNIHNLRLVLLFHDTL